MSLIWREVARSQRGKTERSQLPPQSACTFAYASGFLCKGPGRPQSLCPTTSSLALPWHKTLPLGQPAEVWLGLFSQPSGRVWRQGRKVCGWQMSRYLCPKRLRRQLPRGRELLGHRNPAHGFWAPGAAALNLPRSRMAGSSGH